MSLAKEDDDAVPQRRRLSCTVYLDALCFCYSPVHQMQQYYRLGTLDNCSQKWSNLFDCLNLKTKRSHEVEEHREDILCVCAQFLSENNRLKSSAQEILETREKAQQHIWSFRSPEEAASNWNELFGHSDNEVN